MELRECFGELLHVDVAGGLLALLLGLGGCCCGCSVGLACWAGLLQSLEEVALGVAECLRWEVSVVSWRREKRTRASTYDCVGALISLLLEVEIVLERGISSLGCADGSEGNGHVELSPSLLSNRERWVLDHYSLTCQSGSFQSSITSAVYPAPSQHNVPCLALLPKLSWSRYVAFSKHVAGISSPS